MFTFHRTTLFAPLALFTLALTAACSSSTEVTGGTDGASSSSSSTGSSAGSGKTASFAEVQAIFDARCTNCHDASKQGLPFYPSLSLVHADAYAALVGKTADESCGGTRVVAGAPNQSYLMQKLGPGDPCDGSHMPTPFEVGPRRDLSSAELETVRSWIAGGAQP
jgi:hypothetical protein